ncbi:hypothetical protein [Paenibacillus lautus]|uniref:hypothetical protein n=1 Tax=Paenibacillus lautus TaxID=1401 RepID=UPI002DBAB48D|nr:hypothetical protein [Paenibacillus lautus]MEC0257359.1 hypothetical protein [Paenibacillus lautus]
MNVAELTQAMAGHETTDGWDLVCCYTESKINAFLAQKHKSGKLAQLALIKFSDTDAFTGEQIDYELDILLSEPTLQFIEDDDQYCELLMIIRGGTYSRTISGGDKHSIDIPKDIYQLICKVKLAGLKGDGSVYQKGESMIFTPGEPMDIHIYLHFENPDFELRPVPDQEQAAMKAGLLQPGVRSSIEDQIKDIFRGYVKDVDYAIGGVTNRKNEGSIALEPRSVSFSTSKVSGGGEGTLNLYVQTVNSGNDQGHDDKDFRPGGKAALPVPDGHNASLILSNGLFFKTYLTSQLNKLGWNINDISGEEGVKAEFFKIKRLTIPGIHQNDGKIWLNSDDIVIDYGQVHYNLEFNNKDIHLTWRFEQDVRWNSEVRNVVPGQPVDITDDQGKITVTITIDKHWPPAVSRDGLISVDCSLTSGDYNIEVNGHYNKWFPSFAELFENSLKAQLPGMFGNVSLQLQGIDVFVVSNLLLPKDENNTPLYQFQFDQYHVPKDVLLIGNIVDLKEMKSK